VRNKIAVLPAFLPLMLGAAGAYGEEVQFQTPTTDRAQQTQPLLSRAAQAVHDQITNAAGSRISNLWIFPTGDDHTVFAEYIVTTNKVSSTVGATRLHLELLRMEGDQIVARQDLTRISDDSALLAREAGSGRDWSASIGDGHTTSTTTKTTVVRSAGSPASVHWSASIASGHPSDESAPRVQVAGNLTKSQATRVE
jgi:hypothetical protein